MVYAGRIGDGLIIIFLSILLLVFAAVVSLILHIPGILLFGAYLPLLVWCVYASRDECRRYNTALNETGCPP